ncbi:MAG: hypothetical protein ACLTXL_16260 [Clostridia bacterium]
MLLLTTALNKLLEDKKHVCHVGDTTIVFGRMVGSNYQVLQWTPLTQLIRNRISWRLCIIWQGDSIHWEESLLNRICPACTGVSLMQPALYPILAEYLGRWRLSASLREIEDRQEG